MEEREFADLASGFLISRPRVTVVQCYFLRGYTPRPPPKASEGKIDLASASVYFSSSYFSDPPRRTVGRRLGQDTVVFTPDNGATVKTTRDMGNQGKPDMGNSGPSQALGAQPH